MSTRHGWEERLISICCEQNFVVSFPTLIEIIIITHTIREGTTMSDSLLCPLMPFYFLHAKRFSCVLSLNTRQSLFTSLSLSPSLTYTIPNFLSISGD